LKFALVDGDRTEAKSGLQGTCSYCHSETIAKCGNERIWHWAHKSKVQCDPWREGETPWHRAWKDLFPEDWQEIHHIDPATEDKHVADIKTDKGLVFEFQHSPIKLDEIKSREAFYKTMVWVVDGTRLPRDYRRFCKGVDDPISPATHEDSSSSAWEGVLNTEFPEECFPRSWLYSSVPIYFDFQGITILDRQDERRTFLWGLMPGEFGGRSVVVRFQREAFMECALNNPHLLLAQDICSRMDGQRLTKAQLMERQIEAEKRAEKERNEALNRWWANPRRGRWRRF
jgi:hypothetical protein